MTETTKSNGAGTTSSGVCCPGAGRATAVTLAWTIMTAGLLAFASFAKFYAPQHEKELSDRGIAAVQVLIIIGLLVFWRKWWTWGGLAIMWTGMAAWSIWASDNGAKCGCFGAFIDVPDFASGIVDAMLALVSLSLAFLRGAPRALTAGIVLAMAAAWPAGWYGASMFVPRSVDSRLDEIIGEAGGLDAVHQGDEVEPGGAADAQSDSTTDDADPGAQTEQFGILTPQIPAIPGFTAARMKLFESDLMADIREQELGGPTWLVFVFDPDCHICEELMPYMDFMGSQWEETGDPVMQVRKYSIPEVRTDLGIERHEWPDTPTIFVVRDSEIVAQWYGATAEGWTDEQIQMIYDAFELDDPSLLPAEPQWKELEALNRNQ